MAYAMIGGIIIATLLTLLFLPALYVAWYKIREPSDEDRQKAEAEKKAKQQSEGGKDSGSGDEDRGEPAPAR